MAIRNFITKSLRSLADKMEVKGVNGGDTLDNVLASIYTAYGIGVKKGIGWLTCLGAINYYNDVSPIANAVDLIAQKVAEIYVSIWDKREKKYIKEDANGTPAKVLELLEKGDLTRTYSEYMIAQASYYLITGNAFLICQWLGDKGEPINVLLAKPQDILIEGTGTSIANKYRWIDGNRSLIFTLDPIKFRYFAEDEKGLKYELKQLKMFNPKENTGNLWGQSKLTQIYLEMEQYIAGAVHNKKLLANGARPSGVLTLDEEMSNDAYEKARAEVNSFYSGAENAGNILIFEGQGSKFESFNISPRDMDFANLSEKNITAIYNRLNIPLPFVSDKTMTYNNLAESLYQLYILAVLPLTEAIFEGLTDLIMWHYKDGDNYEIHYDEMDIDVMAKRKRDENKEVVKLGITTYNEARGFFALDELKEGGDDLYVSPMIVPLSQVASEDNDSYSYRGNGDKNKDKDNVDDDANEDNDNNNSSEEKKKKSEQPEVEEKTFRAILKRQNYSDEQISEAVEKIYGNK